MTREPHGRVALLVGVKAVHTLVWLSIESCVGYLIWSGWMRRTDRRAGIAGAIVAAECLVFARSLPALHVPLLLLAGYLHTRNAVRVGTSGPAADASSPRKVGP